MIIRRSEVSLASTHAYQVQTHVSESMRAWADGSAQVGTRPAEVGDPGRARRARPVAGPGPSGAPPVPRPGVGAGSPSTGEDDLAGGTGAGSESRLLGLSGRWGQLVALIERLTGERVQVLDPSDLEGSAGRVAAATAGSQAGPAAVTPSAGGDRAGWGVDYRRTETRVEQEATAFHAEGSVTTADGRQIDLEVDLRLYRSATSTSSTSFQAGDAVAKDPLVLSFGTAPALSGARVGLDLDGDGTLEQVPFVAAGSAFLTLDRNGNGVVDGGAELFGPTTGDGFAELAGYDQDGNGWIDEGDAVFSQLRLWQDPTGTPATLADRGVGAIGLAGVGTPFTLVGSQGEGRPAGAVRTSGVWLGEDGSVGTVHQLDVNT
jgi:hypothetical protein